MVDIIAAGLIIDFSVNAGFSLRYTAVVLGGYKIILTDEECRMLSEKTIYSYKTIREVFPNG